MVKNEWAKHVGSVISISPYLLEIKLFFKGVTIKVIQLYVPPNDDAMTKHIMEYIKSSHVHKDNFRAIIMGDFNAIIDKNLDKQGGSHKTPKQNSIIQSISHFNYIDTF